MVFISNRSSLLDARKFVESNKYTFPVFYDFDKSIVTGFKVKGVPFNLKIRKSVIEDISEGTMTLDGLNENVYGLVKMFGFKKIPAIQFYIIKYRNYLHL